MHMSTRCVCVRVCVCVSDALQWPGPCHCIGGAHESEAYTGSLVPSLGVSKEVQDTLPNWFPPLNAAIKII